MRKLLVVVFSFFGILVAKSQNLTVEGTAPDLYVIHTVAPKENFYSIARLYNQTPKSIASFNNILMEKGLTVGQKVKVPLNDQNLDVSDNATGENLIPLTHIVAKNETLFKIAGNNNATAQLIRKWNNLSSDNIAAGTPLVIGHLKMNNDQSPGFANHTTTTVNGDKPSKAAEAKQTAKDAKKDDPFASVDHDSGLVKMEKPDESSQEQSTQNENEAHTSANSSLAPKDTALSVIPEKTTQADNVANPAEETPLKQQETTPTKVNKSKRKEQTANETSTSTEGAFANLFVPGTSDKSLNTKSGEAATFKSTSGWQDKKYYVLMSNVAPGTILKISSAENKVVYAKVLGSMPEMKENEGLLLRISNAAASHLGIIDPKFPVQISYYQ